VSVTIDMHDPEAVATLFDQAAAALRGSPHREHCIERLPARGVLLATGDLHDNAINLAKVKRLADLDRSPDHHVILHELIHSEKLINGLDFSYRMLTRVAELVTMYPGQVHPLLANHELSQMTGKGVSKGAGNSVELFNNALQYVFDERWPAVQESINRFIAALPIAILSESGLLCAHSLPSAGTMDRFDLDLLQREMTPEDYLSPFGAAYLMVWGRQYTNESVRLLADRWHVTLFCVGHQHVDNGIEVRCRLVVILNSDHERARALRIGLDRIPTAEEALMAAIPLSAVTAE
jgi:hypothetical protein